MSSSVNASSLERIQTRPASQLPNIVHITQPKPKTSMFESGRLQTWNNRGRVKSAKAATANAHKADSHIHPVICAGKALDRHGNPMLVELVFEDDDTLSQVEHAVEYFRSLEFRDSVLDQAIQELSQRARLNNIYVPADLAHPYGWIYEQLGDRVVHAKAFTAQLMGLRNPILCEHCIRSYTTQKTFNLEYTLYIFHNCVSRKGFMNGSCANCIWHGYTDCQYRYLQGYMPSNPPENQLAWSFRGKDNIKTVDPAAYIRDSVNPDTAPRVTIEWPIMPDLGESKSDFKKRESETMERIKERATEIVDELFG